VKGWAAYVNKLTSTMLRPAWAVFTQISVVPDAKTQFKVVFEALDKVPTELLGAVKARVEEAKASIEAPYPKAEEKPTEGEKPATEVAVSVEKKPEGEIKEKLSAGKKRSGILSGY
jgi:hypothetical protein